LALTGTPWLTDKAPIPLSRYFGLANKIQCDYIQWVVSVGMISEGTDIPRRQVCCHLSRVKTELDFRQVLGRILRVNDATNQDA
ncbi:MAG: superfamily II DNA or RNA helicase, partial [Phenylobacterium sp.]